VLDKLIDDVHDTLTVDTAYVHYMTEQDALMIAAS
jgi:hypothetical protein